MNLSHVNLISIYFSQGLFGPDILYSWRNHRVYWRAAGADPLVSSFAFIVCCIRRNIIVSILFMRKISAFNNNDKNKVKQVSHNNWLSLSISLTPTHTPTHMPTHRKKFNCLLFSCWLIDGHIQHVPLEKYKNY